ncbi:hypothetical protein [Acinetobacter baumannii]|uniref:hypothetical protein n=1 Tax=Acinetobacter baumannii TaxID=470 RepID=UPI003892057B
MRIKPNLLYLLGLIYGRGHIMDHKIVIEFAHKNEYARGIFKCIECDDLVTKKAMYFECNNCKAKYANDLAKKYEQIESTKNSIENSIIPFLDLGANDVRFDIISNKTMTFLIIDFHNKELFNFIRSFYNNNIHKNFRINSSIKELKSENLIEFFNGIFDTAGFPSAGGWLNRSGKKYGRMRAYLQIVSNWHIVVEIDNLLRNKFKLPVHTIDWGHPNIRDSNLVDYYNSSPTSWSREHQLKFFPEYYKIFKFRLMHKQEMFEELINYNESAGYEREECWFPPSPIKKIKPFHPGENDLRLPNEVRRHFDAFWQINLALGCESLNNYIIENKVSKEAYLLTGDLKLSESINISHEKEKNKEKSLELYNKINNTHIINKEKKIRNKIENSPKESDLYQPIIKWLDNELKSNHNSFDHIIYDVSAHNFNFLLTRAPLEIIDIFEYCQKYQIKPDIVALIPSRTNLVLIEVKITPLNIENLGQLLGYCLVSQPELAILISDKPLSSSLILSIKRNPKVLNYTDKYGNLKRIKLAQWINNSVKFYEDL